MTECVDGDYQTFKSKNGAYVREHFFGRYPETAALVADWTDEQIWALQRGGHDPGKVFAAYDAAVKFTGAPSVVLAKTIKGYGMGPAGEGQNIAHQQKHLDIDDMRAFRDRFSIPISEEDLEKIPFYRPAENSPEMKYLRERSRRTRVSAATAAPLFDLADRPRALRVRCAVAGDGRAGDLDDDGVRALAQHALAR